MRKKLKNNIKRIICLISILTLSFNSFADTVSVDEDLFTIKRASNGSKIFFNGDNLSDGDYYVIDSSNSSWTGAYSFDEDGILVDTLSGGDDLVKVSGAHWYQVGSNWKYGDSSSSGSSGSSDDEDEIDSSDVETNAVFDKVKERDYFSDVNSFEKYPSGTTTIKVGILDSGLVMHDAVKPYIKKCYLDVQQREATYQEVANYIDSLLTLGKLDGVHGSHCVGDILAGFGGTNIEIYYVETTNTEGCMLCTDAAYNWLKSQNVDVMSFSYGPFLGQYDSTGNYLGLSQTAVASNKLARQQSKVMDVFNDYKILKNSSAIICQSAGNDNLANPENMNSEFYKIDNGIIVGALDTVGDKASYSNYGTDLRTSNLGTTYSIKQNNGWEEMTGTSMACPFTAGMIARALSRGMSKQTILNKLKNNVNLMEVNLFE